MPDGYYAGLERERDELRARVATLEAERDEARARVIRLEGNMEQARWWLVPTRGNAHTFYNEEGGAEPCCLYCDAWGPDNPPDDCPGAASQKGATDHGD